MKRPEREGENTHKGNKKRLVLLLLASIPILGILSVLTLIGLTYFGVFGKIPTEADLHNIYNFNASEIYFEDEVLLGKYFIENRSDVNIGEISPHIVNALIATEDARFMEHSGIDLRAAARVLWKSILLRQESSGGGSTISQQLAKNLYPRENYG